MIPYRSVLAIFLVAVSLVCAVFLKQRSVREDKLLRCADTALQSGTVSRFKIPLQIHNALELLCGRLQRKQDYRRRINPWNNADPLPALKRLNQGAQGFVSCSIFKQNRKRRQN